MFLFAKFWCVRGHLIIRVQELQLLRHGSLTDNLLSTDPIPRVSSPIPLSTEDSSRYLEYQRGLINLHRETGIPPTVKVLNNEVRRIGELAVAGGFWSDIWQGLWLDEEKVGWYLVHFMLASYG